ncbi:MAG: carbohydrate ABC transporter permease [Sphaerochaetaceae bacterium]|nr:carbohydrate ABC transporter permease [uncultured Sphaerochaeta sp.]MDC7228750.1 carbohydrate ABC transporter permease [Sphaerochaetaceae bacterium]
MISLKTKKTSIKVASFIIKLAIGLAFIAPLIVGLMFSIHSERELSQLPLLLFPKIPTLENYIKVFTGVPILHYLKNSIIVCVVAILGQVIFGSTAAYGFVFFEFPLKRFLWVVILSTMMIPGEVVIITNYVTIQNMGLVNTHAGLFLTSLISGTSIFMMRQYYKQLPKDFKDAATLDGCGDVGFLFKIAMPLSVPTISALAIYQFVRIYNAYFWPLLVTNKDVWRTVQVGVSYLVTGDVEEYGKVIAAAMVAMTPAVLAFIFGQDYIIKGMVSGGVKG